jgi:hypothetical protein
VRAGLALLEKERKWGRERKGGRGRHGAHFKGGWRNGAEEGSWPRVAPHGEEVVEGREGGGQHDDRAAVSAGNGPRPVGAGGMARPCSMAGLNRGGRWLTGGPGATVMGGGGQTV